MSRRIPRRNFKPSPTEGLSDKDPTHSSPSSEEESEVFIGPATARLLESEDPPDYIERTKDLVRRSTICRYYRSPSGCNREDCLWKHENPEDRNPEIKTRVAKATDSSALKRKFQSRFSTSYVDGKMKELHIQNNKLERKNQELETENRELRFLWEENLRLKRLLRDTVRHEGNSRSSYYPRGRPLSRYLPLDEYEHPPSSWRASREPPLRPVNEYGSRFLDRSPRGEMFDPEYSR